MHRKQGIDILKIIAMFMVVILHINLGSGLLIFQGKLTIQYEFSWLIEIASYCAVDVYALISGYLGGRKKFEIHNIVKLWMVVVFYSVLITLVYMIITKEFSIVLCIKAILPVISDQYWYFTAYFCTFFFIPYMNILINSLTKVNLRLCFLSIIGVYSIFSLISVRAMPGGYTVVWICLLYIVGGCIQKGVIPEIKKWKWIVVYILSMIFTWSTKLLYENYLIQTYSYKGDGTLSNNSIFISYTSPTIVVMAIALLFIFKDFKIKSVIFSNIISIFAKTNFSVYLIHAHALSFVFIVSFLEKMVNHLQGVIIIGFILLSVIIYVLCTVIDLFRMHLFKKLKIDILNEKIQKKLIQVGKKLEVKF